MSRSSSNALREASVQLNLREASPQEVGLAVHSLSVLLLRYSAHTSQEMAGLLGVDAEEADALVEAHIHRLTVLLSEDLHRDKLPLPQQDCGR